MLCLPDPDLTVAHVDCDAFYASVEKRDHPELRDKPVIVGGGGRRGVVSTCCYIARTMGVRSAMPTAQALKLCPQAVLLPPDMAKYVWVGRQIREMMLGLTPLVEPLSIDEAFLDLRGCEGVNGAPAAMTLARFAARVEREIGVSVSVGLSDCKFLAKIASDLDKPRGFAVIPRQEAQARLAVMPISRLWGVGKVAERRLKDLGFVRIGDLQRVEECEALGRLGPQGLRWRRLSLGLDDRRVTPERETKSVSAETTFETDVADAEALTATLLRHCERVAKRLKRAGLVAGGVTLKLRLPDFTLRTRARSGLKATDLAPRLFVVARRLLALEPSGVSYRLIGVAATNLRLADEAVAPADLLSAEQDAREGAREKAIDAIRAKFGDAAVVRGLAFRARGE